MGCGPCRARRQDPCAEGPTALKAPVVSTVPNKLPKVPSPRLVNAAETPGPGRVPVKAWEPPEQPEAASGIYFAYLKHDSPCNGSKSPEVCESVPEHDGSSALPSFLPPPEPLQAWKACLSQQVAQVAAVCHSSCASSSPPPLSEQVATEVAICHSPPAFPLIPVRVWEAPPSEQVVTEICVCEFPPAPYSPPPPPPELPDLQLTDPSPCDLPLVVQFVEPTPSDPFASVLESDMSASSLSAMMLDTGVNLVPQQDAPSAEIQNDPGNLTPGQPGYERAQFVAYEICTKPPPPYNVVEAAEMATVRAALGSASPAVFKADVALASGCARKGAEVAACYCRFRRRWCPLISASELPRSGWCALRYRDQCGPMDAQADMEDRVALLHEAFARAESSTAVDASPEVLKIFMAPEFFFRGLCGGNAESTVPGLCSQLQALVSDRRWKHWQFVFGTVRCSGGLDGFSEKPPVASNVAILQRGGFGGDAEMGSSFCRLIQKQHASAVDFLQDTALDARAAADAQNLQKRGPIGGGAAGGLLQVLKNAQRRADSEPVVDVQVEGSDHGGTTASAESSVVRMFGLTLGLEVCLDHGRARLRKELEHRPELGPLEVQLVPSCGMTLRPSSVAVQPGGLVFHCDGLQDGGREHLYGAHSAGLIWGKFGGTPICVLSSIRAHGDNWKEKLNPRGDSALFCTDFDAAGGPTLRIYEPALLVGNRSTPVMSSSL